MPGQTPAPPGVVHLLPSEFTTQGDRPERAGPFELEGSRGATSAQRDFVHRRGVPAVGKSAGEGGGR